MFHGHATFVSRPSRTYDYYRELYESTMKARAENKRIKNKSETRVKLAHNTYLCANYQAELYYVHLHATSILIFWKDGSVSLNSGGWKTKLTKERINDYSPYSVWSKRGRWMVTVGDKEYAFKDDMRIYPDGKVDGYDEVDDRLVNKKKMRIKRYIADFTKATIEGRVKAPSMGECIDCSMVTVDENVPYGEASKNIGHIEHHIQEKYYVPSLLSRALQVGGCMCPMTSDFFYRIWTMNTPIEEMPKFQKEIAARDVSKSLRKYIYKQFGLPL